MSPQRRAPRRKKKIGRRRFLAGLGCAAGAYFLYRSVRNVEKIDPPAVLQPDETPNPALPSGEWRAVWVSYLEWARMNFSSEAAFRADIAALMDNCAALGLNTVLAQVRRCTRAACSRGAISAPVRRGRHPVSTRWMCSSPRHTRGGFRWKPGSTHIG